MKKNIFLLLLICGFAPKILFAQQPANTSRTPNRFLFVVENSSAMKRSSKAAYQTVRDLIASGVEGEMRDGDTYSIWSYDHELNMTFPVERWSRSLSKSLSLSAEDFLKKHRYEGKSEYKTVLPKVYSLIKASKSITVVLISTGNEPIHGTPFDKEMNMIYPQYVRTLREEKLTFVTVLIGYEGRPVAYSVNSSLGPIHIPQPPIKKKSIEETKIADVSVATNTAPVQATNEVAAAKAEPKPDPAPAPEIAKIEPVATNPVPTEPVTVEEKNPEVAVAETNISPQEPAKTAEVKSEVATPDVAANAATDQPAQLSAAQDAPAQPPASQEVEPAPVQANSTNSPAVVASQSMFTPGKLLIAGGILVVAAIILIVLLVRNSHKSQPSIISRSIDRTK